MANIQFLDSNKGGCKGAVLPTVIQEPQVTFDSTTDGTVATVVSGGKAGDAAPYGGTFINKGCEDLTATITYLVGSDCDSCTVDTLTTETIDWVIGANTASEIPNGFWTEISYVLANAAADAKLQMVSFQSCYTPDCPECSVLIPDA